ncbi:MAG TPA: carboxypeptidase-like regulatory domain-containing protein [Planctomycetota bacterium]|nr:carboxypeptidase-like regulatory domain-containing protein [Planctomycetota bacterium]
MPAKALVALLLLVACVAGWFAFQANGADVAPTPATRQGVESKPHAAGAAAPATGEVDRPADARVSEAGLERTAAPTADAGKASDGSVTVRGRLVDRSSKPRAGVAVELMSWSIPDGFDDDIGVPFANGADRAQRPNVTTDADGRFQLALASDRSGALSLPDDDLVFVGEAPRVRGKKGDQDLGEVVVARAGALQGVVHDQNGQPVADVKVSATLGVFAFGSQSTATTAADGTFSVGKLRPGKWTLRTASGKFLPTVEEFTLAAEQRQTDLVVVVHPGHAIAGQVVDDRGQPVAGFKVGSKRKEVRGAVDIERFAADEAATTDHYGFFTLSGLAEATATLKAFGPGHTTSTVADVPVGTGNLLIRVERLAAVEGVLVAGDGTPIAGSRVGAEAPGGGGPGLPIDGADDLPLGGPRARATTAADGSFRVESVPPGSVVVTASGKSHRPVRLPGVDVLPGQTMKGIRLVADLGATARVKVVDERGKPVVNAKVLVERPRGEPGPGGMTFRARAVSVENENGDVRIGGDERALGTAVTDADGTAVVTGLPAGNATVTATHAEFAAALPVRLALPRSGAVEANLTLREPGFVEILVQAPDGSPSSEDSLRVVGPADGDREGESTRSTTDGSGRARVGPLAAGEYTVRLTKPNAGTRFGDAMVVVGGDGGADIASSTRRFTVVAGQTARVELRRPILTKVHGVVTGVDGPVVGCIVELSQHEEVGSFGLPGLGGPSVKTSADGTYALEDIESGSYTLRYGRSDQLVKASSSLEVPPNAPELRHDLEMNTGKLRVQVCAKGTGDPIAGAEVEVVPATAERPAGAPRQERRIMMVSMSNTDSGGESTTMTMGAPRARTDEDGVAEIDDVPVGEYSLKVSHKKHAPATTERHAVVRGQTTECGRVDLTVAGQIRGNVLNADGKQASMALVTSRPVGTETWSEPEMAMGGAFRLTGLATGKYSVRAQQLGNGAPVYSPEVEVDVQGGKTATAELRLPRE